MKPNFTPGPWELSEPNGPGMGWRVGPAWIGEDTRTERGLANARLITAAPELYEALARMVRRHEEYVGESPHDFCGCSYCHALAALKKARGDA